MLDTREAAINKLLDIFHTDIHRKSPDTVEYYLVVARKFLDYTSGDLTRASVLKFFDDSGYCDNSLRTIYYILEHLYTALGIKFPLNKNDLPPPVDEEDVNTPTMSPDNVHRVIQYWRGFPDEYVTSLVFLSTVYGLRATELTDAEVGKKTVVVDVAKRKRKVLRTHIIPDGCAMFVMGYAQMSESMVKYCFRQAVKRAGVTKRDHESWHSIRRSLYTSCLNTGLPKELIKRYMRWAKDTSDMGSVYFHMPFDEINRVIFGIDPVPLSNPPKYTAHPYLQFWLE